MRFQFDIEIGVDEIKTFLKSETDEQLGGIVKGLQEQLNKDKVQFAATEGPKAKPTPKGYIEIAGTMYKLVPA